MISLKRFFFEPTESQDRILREVKFEPGINFILGEKSETTSSGEENKMNGVGKSVLIEAINFCLLKKPKESRVMKIPDVALDPKIRFCLELEISKGEKVWSVSIRRNRVETDAIYIEINGETKSFDTLNDARKYLEYLFYLGEEDVAERPSLRSLLSLLLRDEESRYGDILKPHYKAEVAAFEDLLRPHFYLFQIDLSILEKVKTVTERLKNIDKTITSLRGDFKIHGIEEKEVASYLNDLRANVEKLNLAIESLQPSEGMIQAQESLNDLEIRLAELVNERSGKQFLVKKIKSLPKVEKVNTKQVQMVYNHFKEGLGDLVKKSFDQVLEFKKQIDDFQISLTNEKLIALNSEIANLDERIAVIDGQVSEIYQRFESREKISSLKEAVRLEQEKNKKLQELSSTYDLLVAKKAERKNLKKLKESHVEEVGVLIFEIRKTVSSFEEDLKKMHEAIAGNQRCQFNIEIKEGAPKQFADFDYRINLDGSSGINRIKIFIYDVLLMINKVTLQRHPGFLIHDNIFASTGRDDMVKSLNYLYALSLRKNFQYILTINKDEFESQVNDFDFDYKTLTRVELTRLNPFLGIQYPEISMESD